MLETPAAVPLHQRLDAVPLSRFHWKLLLVSGLGWMFDAMDILVVGSVVAAVSREWNLDATQSQWINTANVAGLFFGALASGWLADRFGRKAIFQATLLIYSIFTGLSAAATSVALLMLLRFLAGLGLGGELPVASTLVSEFAPARHRGRLVVLLESFWAYGSVLAALIGFLVVPTLGWRVALLMGALPALYTFIVRRSLPESPRYLLAHGRTAEADAVVREVERAAGVSSPSSAAAPALSAVPAARVNVAELFAPRYLRRTLVLWVLWATMNFSYYGIFLWLPLQFVRKGFSLNDALLFNLIIALAQVPGYFTAAYLVERWGRRVTLVIFLLAAAIGAYFFGQVALVAQDVPAILWWGSVISFFNLGAWGVVYTYTPELYPTRLRATGAGWAAACGRVFAFLAPLSIAVQIALFGGDQTVFLAFTAIMVFGGLVMFFFGPETRGHSLEAIAE
ncbi:MAG TPA: MFS transporter [Chloroflexota bacterium]|jgi:putative MFS transporter|nr:MFS transporter [Chloroflexota bacterium]